MKYKDIQELTDEELAKKVEEGRAELFNLRFQMATSQLDNTARVKNVKTQSASFKAIGDSHKTCFPAKRAFFVSI